MCEIFLHLLYSLGTLHKPFLKMKADFLPAGVFVAKKFMCCRQKKSRSLSSNMPFFFTRKGKEKLLFETDICLAINVHYFYNCISTSVFYCLVELLRKNQYIKKKKEKRKNQKGIRVHDEREKGKENICY